MARHQYSAVLCYLFFGLVLVCAWRKVLLSDVEFLKFREGRLTSGRRHLPIPQLECTNCLEFWPEEVKCYNRGKASTHDMMWRCTTQLPNGLSLGNTNVQCEGYDYPEDPYVLESSCGLRFNLIGQHIYDGYNFEDANNRHTHHRHSWGRQYRKESGMSVNFLLIFVIVSFLVYNLFCKTRRTPAAPPPLNPYRFGGGDLGGDEYPDGVPYQARTPWGWGSGSNWPNSFWTGFGTGGGLAYLFSRRRPTTFSQPTYDYSPPRSHGHRSSFGGGSHTRTSNSSRSGSSSLRTSSSFATTSRR